MFIFAIYSHDLCKEEKSKISFGHADPVHLYVLMCSCMLPSFHDISSTKNVLFLHSTCCLIPIQN